ncbi:MAG: peptidase [Myxococcales bacterium]|nr:peptidase [Myxococcales bacterium]
MTGGGPRSDPEFVKARDVLRTTVFPRAAAFALIVAACSVGPPGPGVDIDHAMSHVAVLAATPRRHDTAQSAAAFEYIREQLAAAGVMAEPLPVGRVELPEIVVFGEQIRLPHLFMESHDQNLIARFGPPGNALLVMAHYDTVQDSPGAVDNAAAVAILIELARVLHDHAPPQPVLLAFTASEEMGLLGAEALADQIGDHVAFAISLDLIGGTGRLTLNGAGELIGVAEMRWLAEAADRAGVEVSGPPVHRVISRMLPQAERSDHGAFTRRGIRAVHFYDRGQDGEWIDVAYHSERDVLARVDRSSVEETARLVRALTAVAPPAHDGDGYWLPFATNTVVPRWILLVCELALVALAVVSLVLLALDRRKRQPTPGSGLCVGFACYAFAAAITIFATPIFATPHTWMTAPLLRTELGQALILLGILGLATRGVRRFAPWIGRARYLAVALAWSLLIGSALLVVGAAELAWIWLVPAGFIAVAPKLGRAAPIAILATLFPAICALRPNQLREAAWNEFLPPSVPLAAIITALAICTVATAAWYIRGLRLGPLGTLVLAMGSALAVVAGVALLV